MTSHNVRREDADALFAGRPVPGSGLAGVAAFFSGLKRALPDAVPSRLEERQLAAIRQAVAQGTGPARRRQTRFRAFLAPALVKVAALVMFVLVTGGALAATGNLPAYQDKVADALSFVVNLPGGSDETDDGPDTPVRDVQDAPDEEPDVDVAKQTDVRSEGEQSSGSQDTESSSDTNLNLESGRSTSGSTDTQSEGSNEEDQASNEQNDDEEEEEAPDDELDLDEPEIDD